MRYVAILALVTAPVAAQPSVVPPKGSAEQRAIYERGQAGQAAFEQKLLAEAGFPPLTQAAAEKRNVIRALFQDPYMMLAAPAVEIERLPDGSLTLKVVGLGKQSAPAVLPASAWKRLASLQGTLFMRKPYVPWDPPRADRPSPPPPTICHGWIVRFGKANVTGVESASWTQCGGHKQPEAAYATEIARLAVSTRPSCEFEENNPFWSFQTCFSPRPKS